MDSKPVIVPHDRLSQDALRRVIEEFVGREGTDYGMRDVTHESKCNAVKRQIEAGRAVIVFDPATETTHIAAADDPQVRRIMQQL